MIYQTCHCPDAYKVDYKSVKNIYPFLEFDEVIGYSGSEGRPCTWLVVVAKDTSWIKTAFPVERPFLHATWFN